MEYFLKGFNEFANFNGRERRKDYWMFVLVYMLIYVGLLFVDWLIGTVILASLFGLVMLLPSLSFAARRLHDTGRSGWWLLLTLIPLLGAIVVIVFLAQPGEPNDNAFGAAPGSAAP